MATSFNKKAIAPLAVVFLLVNSTWMLFGKFLADKGIDPLVVGYGNGILFILSLGVFFMQKKSVIFFLCMLTLFINQVTGQTIQFEKYTLPNGLKVILHEDHSAPVVAVTTLYHVGSKNEDTARTGFAHFFEHLLFEGSENIKRGEFDKYITNAGGALNANTSQDRTFIMSYCLPIKWIWVCG